MPVLLLADARFLPLLLMLGQAAGSSVGYTAGFAWGQLPVRAVAALLAMTFLAVAEPVGKSRPLLGRYGLAGPIAGVLLAVLSAIAVCWVALQVIEVHNATRHLASFAREALFWLNAPTRPVGGGTAASLLVLIGIELGRRLAGRGRTPAAPA